MDRTSDALTLPASDEDEKDVVAIYSAQLQLKCTELLNEKGVNKIQYNDFYLLLEDFYSANKITDDTHRQYIAYKVSQLIGYGPSDLRLDLFNATKVKQAGQGRINCIILLSLASTGGVVWLLLPQAIIIKVLAATGTLLGSLIILSMLIGTSPKYAKHIKSTTDTYGQLFYDYKYRPDEFASAAQNYNKRLNRTVVYR